MKRLLRAKEIMIEAKEHFVKQSYRNRCQIYGANGRLTLVIPLSHTELFRTPISELNSISYEPWKKIHWRSIISSYKKSPYFEYYEDELKNIYSDTETNLFNINMACLRTIFSILKIPLNYKLTDTYIKSSNDFIDLRNSFHPKIRSTENHKRYFQVFEDQHGFISDLSILDLICNLGPDTLNYLLEN